MSEIKLFHLNDGPTPTASEIPGSASGLEKPLQTLFEHNVEMQLAADHSPMLGSIRSVLRHQGWAAQLWRPDDRVLDGLKSNHFAPASYRGLSWSKRGT